MRRHLAWIFAGTMLLGGLAACSDDDDGGDDNTTTTADSGDSGDETTTTEGDSGDSGDSGGNADVQAYCEQVQSFVDAVTEAGSDPAALAGLSDDAADLGTAGQELAANASDLDEDDAEALTDCTEEAAAALQELVPG